MIFVNLSSITPIPSEATALRDGRLGSQNEYKSLETAFLMVKSRRWELVGHKIN